MIRNVFYISLVFLLVSCSIKNYIPDGEYYLKDVGITCTDKKLEKKYAFMDYVHQHPNSKFLGMNIPLGVYKMAGKDTVKSSSKLLRKIGTPPVLYDSVLTRKTVADIERMLYNEGYLYANVLQHKEIDEPSRKLKIKYVINPGKRYVIRNIVRQSVDAEIDKVINKEDTINSLIKHGDFLNINVLNEERSRLTSKLRNLGYYKFNKEYISYELDTLCQTGTDLVDVVLDVRLHLEDGRSAPTNHKKYYIGNVAFHCGSNGTKQDVDTVTVGKTNIYYGGKKRFRPKLLMSNNKLRPDSLFRDDDLQRSYKNFSQLPAIGYSNINLVGRENSDTLDCDVIVTHSLPKSTSFDVEGTNSAGDLGIALSASYKHNNVFKGSESLQLKLRYAYEAITGLEGYDGENYHEFGAEINMKFPVFLFPFVKRDFGNEHHASSEISLQFNMQNRPEFNRRVLSAAWRYRWGSKNKHISHKFDLLEVNYVYMPWISSKFKEHYLDSLGKSNAILKYNYENILITKLGYTYAYKSSKAHSAYGANALSIKGNIETSGNMLSLVSNLYKSKKNSGGQEKFCGIAYAQYVKGDIELTKSFRIDRNSSIFWHSRLGVAYPYGNSKVLPFEKRYFSGGANSVRGWSVRSLGPGKYNGYDKGINFINQSGDIKLDLNLEYRTHLFWKMSCALFVDAGNIWTIREYEDQPGGCFKLDEFYKQIAVSYGLGLRLNLDFFILRFDAGMKAVDPIYSGKQHYPILSHDFSRDFAFHFAVGMPF